MIDTALLTMLVGLTGIFGMLIGSFLNVVIHRVPAGLSVVSPPSRCPECETQISPADNIPVASWVLLKGRCRQCQTRISVRYPIIELATGLVFAGVGLFAIPPILEATTAGAAVAASVMAVSLLWFAGASIALTAIDLETHRLPNTIVYPSIVIAAVSVATAAVATGDVELFARAAAGGGILFASYLALGLIWKGGMGLGDIKLAAAVGIYLGAAGWGALAVGAFSAFILGGLLSAVLMATGVVSRKSGIPFGPWMLAGAWIGIIAGEQLFAAYLSFVGLG